MGKGRREWEKGSEKGRDEGWGAPDRLILATSRGLSISLPFRRTATNCTEEHQRRHSCAEELTKKRTGTENAA
eukprot:2908745-Rhodomonas_salina.3